MKFERFEYKFAVDPTIAMKIRFDLASSMELDTNAKIKSGIVYIAFTLTIFILTILGTNKMPFWFGVNLD